MVKNKRKRQTKSLKHWQWGGEANNRNRNHNYRFTVGVRREGFEEDEKCRQRPHTFWDLTDVEGCNMVDVLGKLHMPMEKINDIRYENKEIID